MTEMTLEMWGLLLDTAPDLDTLWQVTKRLTLERVERRLTEKEFGRLGSRCRQREIELERR